MENNSEIKTELTKLSPSISAIDKKACYVSPVGYFENLSNNVLEEISNQESISASNHSISTIHSKKSTEKLLYVPENYFQLLPQLVLNSLKKHIEKKQRFYYWIQYRVAAAAVVLFFLGMIIYHNILPQYSNNEKQITAKHSQLNSIENEMDQLSDLDAIEYLKENGHDVNAALVASLTENINLPEAADYLKDEQTLTNCISKLK